MQWGADTHRRGAARHPAQPNHRPAVNTNPASAHQVHAVAEDLTVQGRTTLGSQTTAGAAGSTASLPALAVRGSAELEGCLRVGQNATGEPLPADCKLIRLVTTGMEVHE